MWLHFKWLRLPTSLSILIRVLSTKVVHRIGYRPEDEAQAIALHRVHRKALADLTSRIRLSPAYTATRMTDTMGVKLREEYASRRGSSRASLSDLVDAVDINKEKCEPPFDGSLDVARKRTPQEELWGIFATYALQLSCEDPTRMRVASVIKLLQDCGVIDGSSSEEAKMVENEVAIVCESFLKTHPSERDGTKKLNFTAFLALLLHFAKMVRRETHGMLDPDCPETH